MKLTWWNAFLMFVGILLVLLLYRIGEEREHVEQMQKLQQIEEHLDKQDSLQSVIDSLHVLSWENIEYWIDTLGIKHKDVVIQQIRLETGNLASDICKENHNLFGMKEPQVRETTALGTKRGHAYYSNYIDSIKDYALWQDNMYYGGDYYAFLSEVGYAEAPNYIRYLKVL